MKHAAASTQFLSDLIIVRSGSQAGGIWQASARPDALVDVVEVDSSLARLHGVAIVVHASH